MQITSLARLNRLARFSVVSMSTISRRIEVTDAPVIVSMQQMLRGKEGVLSLAQGIVHWSPPDEAMQAARAAVDEPNTSLYGADDGLPELRAALKLKLAEQNGIVASEVMVTAGANQAYTNVVLALLDAGDPAMLFRPYYFNHLMALQMTGSHGDLVLAPTTPSLQPDLSAIRAEMQARKADGRPQLKMVTMSNPGNPTGVMIPKATLEEASALCAEYGAWLVLDNCYEHFAYPDQAREHLDLAPVCALLDHNTVCAHHIWLVWRPPDLTRCQAPLALPLPFASPLPFALTLLHDDLHTSA